MICSCFSNLRENHARELLSPLTHARGGIATLRSKGNQESPGAHLICNISLLLIHKHVFPQAAELETRAFLFLSCVVHSGSRPQRSRQNWLRQAQRQAYALSPKRLMRRHGTSREAHVRVHDPRIGGHIGSSFAEVIWRACIYVEHVPFNRP